MLIRVNFRIIIMFVVLMCLSFILGTKTIIISKVHEPNIIPNWYQEKIMSYIPIDTTGKTTNEIITSSNLTIKTPNFKLQPKLFKLKEL